MLKSAVATRKYHRESAYIKYSAKNHMYETDGDISQIQKQTNNKS